MRGRPPAQSAGGLLAPTWPLRYFLPALGGASRDGCPLDDLEDELAPFCTDDYLVPRFERAVEYHAVEWVVLPALDGPPYGPVAELGVEAVLGQQCHRLVGELDPDVLGLEASPGVLEQQAGY